MSSKSPLRYPGGKTRAIKTLIKYIPEGITELCSPFLGGGSFELFLSSSMQVYGYDAFAPLVDFWQEAIKDAPRLAKKVQEYHPMTHSRFPELQEQCEAGGGSRLERAAILFALNRASFSGTILSGGMSPGCPRFNQAAIDRLSNFRATNFAVAKADYTTSIAAHPNAFLYLDPPYHNQKGLYGIRGGLHIGFDPVRLWQCIKKRRNWIMSYNDCEFIRDLYKGHKIMAAEWTWGMGNDKQSSEVIIFSREQQ